MALLVVAAAAVVYTAVTAQAPLQVSHSASEILGAIDASTLQGLAAADLKTDLLERLDALEQSAADLSRMGVLDQSGTSLASGSPFSVYVDDDTTCSFPQSWDNDGGAASFQQRQISCPSRLILVTNASFTLPDNNDPDTYACGAIYFGREGETPRRICKSGVVWSDSWPWADTTTVVGCDINESIPADSTGTLIFDGDGGFPCYEGDCNHFYYTYVSAGGFSVSGNTYQPVVALL